MKTYKLVNFFIYSKKPAIDLNFVEVGGVNMVHFSVDAIKNDKLIVFPNVPTSLRNLIVDFGLPDYVCAVGMSEGEILNAYIEDSLNLWFDLSEEEKQTYF